MGKTEVFNSALASQDNFIKSLQKLAKAEKASQPLGVLIAHKQNGLYGIVRAIR